MDSLPFVVLRSILLHVKPNDKGDQNDLCACSLVSQAWHHATTPFLYGIIALDIPRMYRFVQSFDAEKYAGYVVSFTLLPSNRPLSDDRHSSVFQRLVPLLKRMTSLLYFSFYRGPHSGHRWVWRRDIVALLDALPSSVIGLELDTRTHDARGEEETDHICDSLRRILPKMVYVRIRTAAMCSAMFGVDDGFGSQPGTTTNAIDSGPIALPHLRSMIINCTLYYSTRTQRCGPYDTRMRVQNRMHVPRKMAWNSITMALDKVLESGLPNKHTSLKENPEKERSRWMPNPEDVQILVIGSPPSPATDNPNWPTSIRANMTRQESWAIPGRDLRWYGKTSGWNYEGPRRRRWGTWVIRLPDGREMMGQVANIDPLAEGEIGNWSTLLGGARLPTEVIMSPANENYGGQASFVAEICGGLAGLQPPEEGYFRTSKEWRQPPPEVSAPHWTKEEMTGMQVIGAEKRIGDDYLSLRHVVEVNPDGWTRGDQDKLLGRVVSWY
ncbi:F-box domain containing [Fusarium albosuccineum]|uniref:F-box domain containing n=1 Tax=Fusarium albosuccineum TaxID=1237068 RepID=A0A8H4NZY3_9HYPO|nr:F-box domain containing [Fusarium albosuccineum]